FRKMKVSKANLPAHRKALESLVESGQLRQTGQGRVRFPAAEGAIVGIVRKTSSGVGYVLIPPDSEFAHLGDIQIPANEMRDAHTGDEVAVRLLKRRRGGGKRIGSIDEVLNRPTRTFVGV